MNNQKTTKWFMFYMNWIAEFIGTIMTFFMPWKNQYKFYKAYLHNIHKAYGYWFIGFILLITLIIIRHYFAV